MAPLQKAGGERYEVALASSQFDESKTKDVVLDHKSIQQQSFLEFFVVFPKSLRIQNKSLATIHPNIPTSNVNVYGLAITPN